MIKSLFLFGFTAILLCFGLVPATVAVTAMILVGSGGNLFVPAVININKGDKVTWKWIGSNHFATSTGSTWPNTGVQNSGFTFSHACTGSGTFPYYCMIHGSPTTGMRGLIVVVTPNAPPTVSVTTPAAGAVFAALAHVTIQASATNSDGTVSNVQFRVGSTVLADSAVAPFSAVANSLVMGAYTLSAIASDKKGAKATNCIAISVITATMPTIRELLQVPPDNFQFSYTANTGLHYIIERSLDLRLSDWVTISTNTAASDVETFTDTNATNNAEFYHVGFLPNP